MDRGYRFIICVDSHNGDGWAWFSTAFDTTEVHRVFDAIEADPPAGVKTVAAFWKSTNWGEHRPHMQRHVGDWSNMPISIGAASIIDSRGSDWF